MLLIFGGLGHDDHDGHDNLTPVDSTPVNCGEDNLTPVDSTPVNCGEEKCLSPETFRCYLHLST